MISVIDAIILGLVQGLTEFIPVSSSGHLVIVDKLTSVESSFTFDVLINIGTLGALLLYFRNRLSRIVKDIIFKKDYRLLRNVVLSTIPAVLVGLFLSDVFEGDGVRNASVVITMLIAGGLFMVFEPMLIVKEKLKDTTLTWKASLGIGMAQALALIPGTSRSGSTIIGGRLFGLSPAQAAEYSFLIAIPILLGAVVKELFSVGTIDYVADNATAIITGVTVALVSGYVAISTMLKFLHKHGLRVFGIYRIVLGIVLLFIVM